MWIARVAFSPSEVLVSSSMIVIAVYLPQHNTTGPGDDRWTPYAAFSSSSFYFLFVQNGTTSCLFPTEARASLRMAVVSHEVYL